MYREKKDKINLDNAVFMIEKAIKLSNKYILSFRVARDIYISSNNKVKTESISKALAKDKTNFEFLLFCALFYFNEQMYNDAEVALHDFIDSFEKYPTEKYCMDYAIYNNNLSSVLMTSLKICNELSSMGRDVNEIKNRINLLSNRHLSGVKCYNSIDAFSKNKSIYKTYQVTTPLPDLYILGSAGNSIIRK